MAKYRKKPVAVEAEQFFPDKKPWPDGIERFTAKRTENYKGFSNTWFGWRISTPVGLSEIRPGDYVFTDESGRNCVIQQDIFEATYEKI
jgi:hypothetical protein